MKSLNVSLSELFLLSLLLFLAYLLNSDNSQYRTDFHRTRMDDNGLRHSKPAA